MKKLICILFCTTLSASLLAKIRTVSNIDSSAQYSTIQAACDEGVSGDSIYVGDSPNAYDAFTINDKKLAVFGPGWSPFIGGTANVPGCTLTGTGGSGSELHGLTFTGTINIQTAGLNNVIFIRNKLNRVQFNASVSGYLFEGNWFNELFYDPSSLTLTNFMLRNNIFYGSNSIYTIRGVNFTFSHNLFYGDGSCFINCQGLTLSNNIFIGKGMGGIGSSIFNNNLTFSCDVDAPWDINGNNDAGGNLAGQYPQMAAQSGVNSKINNPLLDFSISSGPANNAGSDGKDMGLLYDNGGSLNWARSRAAHLPYMSKLNVSNQSIFKNGKLYFSAEAKSN